MNEEPTTRRRLLRAGAVAGAVGVAGCSGVVRSGDDIEDTDGDGVIDSADYAPRDPSVQRAEQVQTVESTPREDQTPPESGTPPAVSGEGTVIDDFETGALDAVWQQFEHGSVLTGREAFEIRSGAAPEGQYALRGINDGFREYSGIERDDFTIDTDGSTLRLYVKLGPVQSGSERANKIYFTDGEQALIVIDQKDRPGEANGARIGNGNAPNTVMDSVTPVEFRDIRFTDNRIGEVVVGGNTVATDMAFLNEGDEISAVRIFQGHFAQPADIVVDGITYESPTG